MSDSFLSWRPSFWAHHAKGEAGRPAIHFRRSGPPKAGSGKAHALLLAGRDRFTRDDLESVTEALGLDRREVMRGAR
jgi:hypothetical protein